MDREKKRIVHCIDSLSRGGAEMLLKNTIELLPEFDHTVICLFPSVSNQIQVTLKDTEVITLEHKGWRSLISSVLKMRKIIKNRSPILVHSHLFISSICARLAVPSYIPLISSIHSLYSKDAFEKNHKSLLVERLTLKKRQALVAVSQFALNDYLKYIPFQGEKYVLYNFIPYSLICPDPFMKKDYSGKFIAIGNLKEAKNYGYLLEVFRHLNDKNVSLYIYGSGGLFKEIQEAISSENLNVKLCGSVPDISSELRQFDYFIQASFHEGFGISVIEAMAAGLPVFLSDIPVFREITNGNAHFFPLNDPVLAAQLILKGIEDKSKTEENCIAGLKLVQNEYSPQMYRDRLLKIYSEVTGIGL